MRFVDFRSNYACGFIHSRRRWSWDTASVRYWLRVASLPGLCIYMLLEHREEKGKTACVLLTSLSLDDFSVSIHPEPSSRSRQGCPPVLRCQDGLPSPSECPQASRPISHFVVGLAYLLPRQIAQLFCFLSSLVSTFALLHLVETSPRNIASHDYRNLYALL